VNEKKKMKQQPVAKVESGGLGIFPSFASDSVTGLGTPGRGNSHFLLSAKCPASSPARVAVRRVCTARPHMHTDMYVCTETQIICTTGECSNPKFLPLAHSKAPAREQGGKRRRHASLLRFSCCGSGVMERCVVLMMK